MKRYRIDLLLLFFIFIILVSTYVIGTASFIQKNQPEMNDFRWFYSVGKAYRLDGPSQAYDIDLARKYQAQVANSQIGMERLLLPNHPPLVFPIMAILSNMEFRSAYYLYIGISVIIFFPALVTVFITLQGIGWQRDHILIAMIGLILFEPFYVSLLKGQDSYLLYMGGLFLLTGWIQKKDWLSGIGLGLALVRPQIALILVIPFFFHRKKTWWWFLTTAGILTLYSFIQVGWKGVLDYVSVLSLSTGTGEHGWDEIGMLNLVGILIRVFPKLNIDIIHTIGWIIYGLSVVGVCVLFKYSKTISYWQINLTVVLSMFSSPHLHYHDLAFLAIPILGLMIIIGERIDVKNYLLAGLPLFVSLILIFSELWPSMIQTIPYILMAGIPMVIWRLEQLSSL